MIPIIVILLAPAIGSLMQDVGRAADLNLSAVLPMIYKQPLPVKDELSRIGRPVIITDSYTRELVYLSLPDSEHFLRNLNLLDNITFETAFISPLEFNETIESVSNLIRADLRQNLLLMNEHLKVNNIGSKPTATPIWNFECDHQKSSYSCNASPNNSQRTRHSGKVPNIRKKRGAASRAIQALAAALGKPAKRYGTYMRSHPFSGSISTLGGLLQVGVVSFTAYEVGKTLGYWGIPDYDSEDMSKIISAIEKSDQLITLNTGSIYSISLRLDDITKAHNVLIKDVIQKQRSYSNFLMFLTSAAVAANAKVVQTLWDSVSNANSGPILGLTQHLSLEKMALNATEYRHILDAKIQLPVYPLFMDDVHLGAWLEMKVPHRKAYKVGRLFEFMDASPELLPSGCYRTYAPKDSFIPIVDGIVRSQDAHRLNREHCMEYFGGLWCSSRAVDAALVTNSFHDYCP